MDSMDQTHQMHQNSTVAEVENGFAGAMVPGRIQARHCLEPDAVYRHADGEPVFVAVPAPTDEELQALLNKTIAVLIKPLTRRGVLIGEEGATYLADDGADPDATRGRPTP